MREMHSHCVRSQGTRVDDGADDWNPDGTPENTLSDEPTLSFARKFLTIFVN